MKLRWSWVLLLAVGCGEADIELPEKIEFNRHVRPILSNSCLPCHGPDANARQANLRLDVREIAIAERDGIRAIVPGSPGASELFRRVTHPDPAERMPPVDSERKLDDYGRALLERWIAEGAEHWAYVPPSRPEIPEVGRDDWVRQPVDDFVLTKLEERGVSPSIEADRITLARRLSFDLTGLPPTPDDVDAFVADASPDAYEKLVDGLLASPHYGERMAIDWLDQVRFADTNGYHSDEERPVYPYRDYIIAAFNENLPFDTFTREQLAGDLLPNATTRQKIASAFNRLNQISAEGGAQPKEYRAKYNADRVRAVASVWMGATVGCAECHDHKFDSLRSKDFYSMAAFFADIQEEDVYIGRSEWDPFLLLPNEDPATALDRLNARIASLQSTLRTTTPALEREQAAWEAALRRSVLDWVPTRPAALDSRDGTVLELLDDLSILATGPNPDEDVFTLRLPTELESVTGLRLEVMSHPSFRKGLSRENVFFALHELEVDVRFADGNTERIAIAGAVADEGKVRQSVDGDEKTAWVRYSFEKYAPTLRAVYAFAQPVAASSGTEIVVRMKHLGVAMVAKRTAIGRFRLSLTSAEEPQLEAPVGIPEVVSRAYFRTIAPSLDGVRSEVEKLYRVCDGLHRRDRPVPYLGECYAANDARPAARKLDGRFGRGRRARGPGISTTARGNREAGDTPRPGQLARLGRAPSNSAGRRESAVETILRRRSCARAGRSRLAGWASEPSRSARLARCRVS